MISNNAISNFLRKNRSGFETMLRQLVELPTVSADPNRKDVFRKAAILSSSFLQKFGAKTRIHETKGHPIVIGEFPNGKARKFLTIYNHLDVQPAQESEWKTDPFQFVQKGDQYFGRGTTDDKGPALVALFAAALAQQEKIPLKIRFLWEMEEEIGSPHFETFIRSQQRSLKLDSILVVDSIWISERQPTIYYALRGNVTGSMFLETADNDVHSGITGGIARNPMAELMEIAVKIQDPKTGKIRIPGFYREVRRIEPQELRRLRELNFDLPRWAKSYGFKAWRKSEPIEALSRVWCRPTFEVHGMVGGYTGSGVKTAIPPRAELKWSTRLVPDQDPETATKQIIGFVRRLNPEVEVRIHSKLRPYLGSSSGFHAEAAASAIQLGFGRTPVFARAGGSDGAIAILQKYLKKPIVLFGLSLPKDGYHAPNENFDWQQAAGGIKTFAHYFTKLAEQP